ncbi:hypothetical protein CVT25_007724 [Psilocybe cyanescens]|uniref:Laccase n=1 Tax=Psilocybe cyanescens TaxID=93625 RepID=A0A409XHT2_PSICY|nr:hypothetical protein CVT25_007724 [Psilocybe cyanescens]
MRLVSMSFFVVSCATHSFASIGPSSDLYIVNAIVSPDGYNRSAVLAGANATSAIFPGPLITANKADTFSVNVVDQLTDTTMLMSTSIHWHGLFQEGSTWADGVVGVTQCPITPNNSFTYQFSVADEAGTYWYHSHYSTQYCDGLRGPLVVYDPSDPYISRYHLVAPQEVIEEVIPTSDATLINGLGRYARGPTSALAVISVIANKRFRFRLVSISCDPNFTFSIDGHAMTIIEADGVNTQPLVVDSIQIFSGQRYSFILTTDQAIDNYWIRANSGPTGTSSFDGGINSAILRYVNATVEDPITNNTSSNPLVETNLVPVDGASAPGVAGVGLADVNINLDFGFNGAQFTVNDVAWVTPTVMVLLQIMSGTLTAQDLLPSGSIYVLPSNQVIEISMPGGSAGSPHPLHLHGHTFSVVRSAGNATYNYDNPIRRDVVSTGSDTTDNVTIRFTTDNSGPWILHWWVKYSSSVFFRLNVLFLDRAPNKIISTGTSTQDLRSSW